MGYIAQKLGVADGLEDLMRHIRVEIESFFRDNDIPEYRTVRGYNQRTDYERIFEVERMLSESGKNDSDSKTGRCPDDETEERGSLCKLAEVIAEVVRDGAKMCEHRLRDKTGKEINFAVRVKGRRIYVIVVNGHGIVTALVYESFTICKGDEKLSTSERILKSVEERFLSEYNRWKKFFNANDMPCD